MHMINKCLGLTALCLSLSFIPAGAEEEEALYEVNFIDTELTDFIDSVSRITSTTFIIDPRVKGKVTVRSARRWPVPTWKTSCRTPKPSFTTPRKTPTST